MKDLIEDKNFMKNPVNYCEGLIMENEKLKQEMSLQQMLDELPVGIQKKVKKQCYCCGTVKDETVTYNLKIDVSGYDNYGTFEHRYKVYYYCPDVGVIGEVGGLGKCTLVEAINELKDILKNEH